MTCGDLDQLVVGLLRESSSGVWWTMDRIRDAVSAHVGMIPSDSRRPTLAAVTQSVKRLHGRDLLDRIERNEVWVYRARGDEQ